MQDPNAVLGKVALYQLGVDLAPCALRPLRHARAPLQQCQQTNSVKCMVSCATLIVNKYFCKSVSACHTLLVSVQDNLNLSNMTSCQKRCLITHLICHSHGKQYQAYAREMSNDLHGRHVA